MCLEMSSFNVARLQFLQLHLPASVCLQEYQRDHHFFESRVIQQVFSATDSSRKRWNKYFIFNLLKSNVVCNRVLEGAQPCWKQICDSKLDFFDWFNLAFERRGAQRKLWAPVLYIWPKFSLQKYFRCFGLGSGISFRMYIFWYIPALAMCSVWFMESLQRFHKVLWGSWNGDYLKEKNMQRTIKLRNSFNFYLNENTSCLYNTCF